MLLSANAVVPPMAAYPRAGRRRGFMTGDVSES